MTGKLVTRSRTLYTFEELSDDAKSRLIDATREEEHRSMPMEVVEYELVEYLLGAITNLSHDEVVTTSLHKHFTGEVNLEWSLSHCQGDGVALYGRIYRDDAPLLTWHDSVAYLRLVRNSYGQHYSHYNSFSVEFYNEDDDLLGQAHGDTTTIFIDEHGQPSYMGLSERSVSDMNEVQQDMYVSMNETVGRLRRLCRKLAIVGYHAIDEFTSEERAIELLTEYNGRKYDEHGNVVELLWWEDC